MLLGLIEWLMYSLLNMDKNMLSESIIFFIYDSIKIMFLLFIMIFLIGFLRTYIPLSKFNKYLKKAPLGISNLFASVFGALTPFCSCSSIPLFLGFIKAKIPLGIAFSFLITSPLVNEYLVVLMLGFFGWKITVIYVVLGVMMGVVSGIILQKMGVDKYIEKDMHSQDLTDDEENYSTFYQRIKFGLNESQEMLKKLWLWIFIGVGIGAFIHNAVPQSFVDTIVSGGGFFTVPLAVIIGIPMYGSCAAIVPIALALFEKGFPLGTALAFMMSTSALSLPQAVILRRAMKLRLIFVFFGVVTFGIILIGYILNSLSFLFV